MQLAQMSAFTGSQLPCQMGDIRKRGKHLSPFVKSEQSGFFCKRIPQVSAFQCIAARRAVIAYAL
jgi:hypothetical protein